MAPLGHLLGQQTLFKTELDSIIEARYENQNLFFSSLLFFFKAFYFCLYPSGLFTTDTDL